MNNENYVSFMCNPDNIHNCDVCPERMSNYDSDTVMTLSCGQFHCWVDITCNSDSDDSDADE